MKGFVCLFMMVPTGSALRMSRSCNTKSLGKEAPICYAQVTSNHEAPKPTHS